VKAWHQALDVNTFSVDSRGWWDGEVYCAGRAELLAATNGIVPLVEIPGLHTPGVVNYGKALEHLDNPKWDPVAKELYLTCHRNFHRARSSLEPAGDEAKPPAFAPAPAQGESQIVLAATPADLLEDPSELANLPQWILIAAIVSGVLGGMILAWELGHYMGKAVPGGVLKDQAAIDGLIGQAIDQMAKGKKVDPAILPILKTLRPAPARYGGYLLAGGALLGIGTLTLANYYGRKR